MAQDPITQKLLLEWFVDLDTPEGFRAELIEKELHLSRGAEPWMSCDGVSMVLEVTSSKLRVDREIKRRCYARGGIPLYLLVDRETSWATLFSDPAAADYRELRAVAFGRPLTLPEPFAFALDTSDFL